MFAAPSVRRLIATSGAVGVTLIGAGACNTSPGAAAIVAGHRITISDLQNQVRDALTNPQAAQKLGSNRALFTREVLAQVITERVVAATAAAHHITITSADVNAELQSLAQSAGSLSALKQQAAQEGVSASAFDAVIRTDVLANKVGDALIQSQIQAEYNKDPAQFQQAHVAHILVANKALAQQILRKVERDPASFATLAKRYSTDTGSKNSGGDLGFVGKGQTVAAFDQAIFTAKIGSYVLVHSQYGWHVVHVIARRSESLAQAAPQLKQQLSQQQQALFQRAFIAESRQLDIRVSPRYGTWDASQQAVQATKDSFSVAG